MAISDSTTELERKMAGLPKLQQVEIWIAEIERELKDVATNPNLTEYSKMKIRQDLNREKTMLQEELVKLKGTKTDAPPSEPPKDGGSGGSDSGPQRDLVQV
jgi:hypothetical protein